jgi:hypothetical protein
MYSWYNPSKYSDWCTHPNRNQLQSFWCIEWPGPHANLFTTCGPDILADLYLHWSTLCHTHPALSSAFFYILKQDTRSTSTKYKHTAFTHKIVIYKKRHLIHDTNYKQYENSSVHIYWENFRTRLGPSSGTANTEIDTSFFFFCVRSIGPFWAYFAYHCGL